MRKVDAIVRKTTIEKFGPVRSVTPTLVFEIGFEGIQASPRHKSGIAVRFPRMLDGVRTSRLTTPTRWHAQGFSRRSGAMSTPAETMPRRYPSK